MSITANNNPILGRPVNANSYVQPRTYLLYVGVRF